MGWGQNKATVKFYNVRKFEFAPELSGNLSLDDEITTINAPVAAIGAALGDLVEDQLPFTAATKPIVFGTLGAFFEGHGQSLFQRFKVRDLIYGYRVRFLDTLSSLTNPLGNLGLIPDGMLPEGLPNNTFGLLYGKTNLDGPYEAYTGRDGTSSRYQDILKYKDEGFVSICRLSQNN